MTRLYSYHKGSELLRTRHDLQTADAVPRSTGVKKLNILLINSGGKTVTKSMSTTLKRNFDLLEKK